MRLSRLAPIAFAVTALLCSADIRPSGHVIEQTRPVADFHGITSRGAYVLDVTVGPSASLKIKGDDNLLAVVQTSVRDGLLSIQQGEHDEIDLQSNHIMHIEVTTPHLDSFSGEGAGKTVFHGLKGGQFALAYSGAGLLTASGDIDQLTVEADGTGSLDLRALHANSATVNLEGVGAINIYARKTLTANVEGIGSLTYYGHPSRVTRAVSGIGSIGPGD